MIPSATGTTSSTPTISYDTKTQESYNNILDDRPYRSAQPKVFYIF